MAVVKLKDTRREARVVDLFCGGGGLSCGFDHYRGSIDFRTVLGLDNDPAAVRIYNANSVPESSDASFGVGRLSDATWFVHATEIRLYYLVHLASTRHDTKLQETFDQIGLNKFLSDLKAVDVSFSAYLSEFAEEPEYKKELANVPSATFALALPKALLARLGLTAFRRPKIASNKNPWIEEYHVLLKSDDVESETSDAEAEPDLIQSCEALWESRISEIAAASARTGRGQHKNNAARLASLSQFLSSSTGNRLKTKWIAWRSMRDTIRARFCLRHEGRINELYSSERRVHVVLGGPPCKGFSRIGRPVIEDLRNQGVHAWSHKDFGDERNALMCQYVLFLEALEPDIFLFENVSNFQSELKTPSGKFDAPALLEELIDDLSNDGLHYHIQHKLLNARHFSVPQDRRRFIMFGVNAVKATSNVSKEFFEFGRSEGDVPLSLALNGLGEAKSFDPKAGVKTSEATDVFHILDERMPTPHKRYLEWIQQPDPQSGKPQRTTTAHIFREGREDDRVFINLSPRAYVGWISKSTSHRH